MNSLLRAAFSLISLNVKRHKKISFGDLSEEFFLLKYERAYLLRPQQFLYFLPEPQGQGSLRPIFLPSAVLVRF